jgi:hypothetical protein
MAKITMSCTKTLGDKYDRREFFVFLRVDANTCPTRSDQFRQ